MTAPDWSSSFTRWAVMPPNRGDYMTTIRELRRGDDLSAVLALCREFFAEYENHHEEFFATDNLADDDISGRFLASIDSEESATIVALDDGVIVGYALLAVREQPRFYKVKRVGAISALMVARQHRRKGIGTRLLAESRVFFARRGIRYYTFYTSVENRAALGLYDKVGIKPLQTVFLGET
jgi:ribosomal protein S18 acetylase RimI-like enzyme